MDFRPRQPDYLTDESLIDAHGRLHPLMHAANPYGCESDYAFFERNFPGWLTKTVNLLDAHVMRLPGNTGFCLVQMGREDYPSWTPFLVKSADQEAAPQPALREDLAARESRKVETRE